MSSNHDQHEPQHHGSQDGGSVNSRKPSLATQNASTSDIRASNFDNHELDPTIMKKDSGEDIPSANGTNFAKILQSGLDFLENPIGGREWLLAFGAHSDETDVSLHFRTVKLENQSERPFSILPLLSLFAQSWYALARKKRKSSGMPRTAHFSEQNNFDWLLRYVSDYLSIGHDFFDEREQLELCNTITNICQDTSRSDDIFACIHILHAITTYSIFPKDGLQEALEVMCAATIILPDPPSTLDECVKLLLTGPVQQQTVICLLEFAITPTVQNNSKKLTCGRGALRQLGATLKLLDSSGNNIISISQLAHTLYQASKCCIFRYCSEIMKVCHTIFNSQQHKQAFQAEFVTFIDTIDNCIRTMLPRSTSTRSLTSLQVSDRDQVVESEKQNTKYLGERNHVLKALLHDFEQQWSIFTREQQNRICNFFMDHYKQLSDAQALIAVSHLEEQTLTTAMTGDRSQNIGRIFEAFIRNAGLAVETRIKAISLCAETAAGAIAANEGITVAANSSFDSLGQTIVDRLLNLTGNDPSSAIVKAALSSLKMLMFSTGTSRSYPYCELILRKLLWFIRNEREGNNDDVQEGHIDLFGRFLESCFITAIHQSSLVASRTFDALLETAGTSTKSRKCRLLALRVLVRIRCDAAGMVYLQTSAESEYIAVALCRTTKSRESFAQDLVPLQRSVVGTGSSFHFAGPKQLWSYPDESTYVQGWSTSPSSQVGINGHRSDNPSTTSIKMSNWLVKVIECLQTDGDWETYSFIIIHFGAQLFNTKLFDSSLEAIVVLRKVLCDQVVNNLFREPPASTGLKKSDTALCMFNMLTALIPYATLKSEIIQKGFGDDLVRAFITGVGGIWEGTARGCIHALCICSFEVPSSVASSYPSIVSRMSKSMTQSHLTVHILEFLAQVARLPEVHSNFTQDEITMIFGICVQFLEKARDHHTTTNAPSPRASSGMRHSGLNLRRPPYRAALLEDEGLPQYASALAFHTLIFWFLSLQLGVRAQYVSWIVPRLIWKNTNGDETIDEQSQVFIDMMQRTAFSDLGETKPDPRFATNEDGAVSSSSWMIGLSVVTVETAGHTGITQITKRQASGTTHAIYRQLTAPLPSHHVPSQTEIRPEDSRFGATAMLPSHILLQMMTSAAATSAADQPIPLPSDDITTRTLNVFDRIPTVDGHKLGVLYAAPGQTKESDILANSTGSSDYEAFLKGLGYPVSLMAPLDFNPQGLECPRDGDTTIAFRDRVTEIVFHVPTMMPTNHQDDPSCNTKKAHVGNCNVIIVFNESGIPWKMQHFPSQVTSVHIVITPANCGTLNASVKESSASEFYHLHVLTKEDYPNVTPAADPKVISREMLPSFVRMFALNANVFSQAKIADDSADSEFTSNWRARLQQIKRLKQRTVEASNTRLSSIVTTPHYISASSATSGRRTPVSKDSADGEDEDDVNALAVQLDFGKWTL